LRPPREFTSAEARTLSDIYDVIIVGAGVVGSAAARELSRFKLKTALLEKEPDVALQTSCRNSGVLHCGINYRPGTLKAKLSVRGNSLMDKICAELKVPIKRIGKLTVAADMEEASEIPRLMEQGVKNGVRDMEVFDREQMERIQPGVQGLKAIWTPTSAIVSPFKLAMALAENAKANGTDCYLNAEVASISKDENGIFTVGTENGLRLKTRVIVNTAGLGSGKISAMAGVTRSNSGLPLKIWPRRGEYYVLDKRLGDYVKTLVYPFPSDKPTVGLGIHITPTVSGVTMVGPSADYICDETPEDYGTTARIMKQLKTEGRKLMPEIEGTDFIRSFAGNEARLTPPGQSFIEDFAVERADEEPHLINAAGIDSPGLTSAPAIAERIRDILDGIIKLEEKDCFIAEREGFACTFHDLPEDEQIRLIAEYPDYGEIICRCEKITKKEVKDAIENPLGAASLAGVKYRAGSGMGRCQGGFCTPRIVRILRDEYGFKADDYILRGKDSKMFAGNVREMEI
jgi:glycerol-3-phosphate dehydrogenase